MILLRRVFNHVVTKLKSVDFHMNFIDMYAKVFHGYKHDQYIKELNSVLIQQKTLAHIT